MQVVSNMCAAVMESNFSAKSSEIKVDVDPLPSIRSIWKVQRGTNVVCRWHVVHSNTFFSFVCFFCLHPEHSSTQNFCISSEIFYFCLYVENFINCFKWNFLNSDKLLLSWSHCERRRWPGEVLQCKAWSMSLFLFVQLMSSNACGLVGFMWIVELNLLWSNKLLARIKGNSAAVSILIWSSAPSTSPKFFYKSEKKLSLPESNGASMAVGKFESRAGVFISNGLW